MIVCQYCKREFKSLQAYYAHKCEGYVNEILERKRKKEEDEKNGEFVCNGCGRKFKTKNSLKSHARFCENYKPISKYDENGNYISKSKYKQGDVYVCECGKTFDYFQSLNAHLSHCDVHHQINSTLKKQRPYEVNHKMCGWENKTKEELEQIHKKAARTRKTNIEQGVTKNIWLGRKHKESTKEQQREGMLSHLSKLYGKVRTNYNAKSCEYIDRLNEEKGWHLQHAQNGGEVKKCGYFLDGYDEKLNIAFEYDEPRHYQDVERNILKPRDIERQKYIISQLNCEFWRYNEKMNLLYKVK